MKIKKYILEELEAIDKNIIIAENFIKSNACSNLDFYVVSKVIKTLKDVRDLFSSSKSQVLQVEDVYDQLPALYMKLSAVVSAKKG